MKFTSLVPGLFLLDLGGVNAYLITHDGMTLVDTGSPGDGPRILDALAELGYSPQDLTHILITHHHPDHSGGLAMLKQATGAKVMAHVEDAGLIEKGIGKRPALKPAPGLLNRILFQLLLKSAPDEIEPCLVDEVWDTDKVLDLNGGLELIHTPGHTAGHTSLLWHQQGGVLLASDVAVNIPKLRFHPGYESFETGRQSLRRLASLTFDKATFGHGRPLLSGASGIFKKSFGV